jgi:hypothetical protein
MNGTSPQVAGRLRRALQIVAATACLTFPVAALSRIPSTPPAAADAILRLSWRMDASGLQECRVATGAELSALPVHMRAPMICPADRASYLLITRLAGVPDTAAVVRGGVRRDRPLVVLRESRVPLGEQAVHIQLRRLGDGADELLLELDTVLPFERGAVWLVTTDGEGDRLRAVTRQPR